MSASDLAARLKEYATNVKLDAFKRSKRGPKRAATPRTKHTDKPHVSTARLLARGGYKT